ncbi:MAG: S8 family serine peptidase, partial [Syntrophales bacterium]|nr:S8 family serine peptidase [Syntrophales bacterium]
VLAAAGNTGPAAESITVPGNDPYVITVGAVDSNRTPGYWADDILPAWSATGPTLDGFLKPDVLAPGANIVSFMYNDPDNIANSAWLVQQHPDYSETTSLFRMSGTSMATAAASGVVALMLEAHPELTPDQIKFRLVYTARAADTEEGDLVYNIFQQGVGRIWAPDAVLGDLPADGVANGDMDNNADLAHGWETDEDIAYHYEGLVQKLLSDDDQAYLYYVTDEDGNNIGLGVAWEEGLTWVDQDALSSGRMAWSGGQMTWSGGMSWAGGLSSAAGRMAWSGGRMAWSGGRMAWSGGRMAWSGGRMAWSGGRMAWSGGLAWAGGRMAWSGGLDTDSACVSTTTWVDEWYVDD